MATWKQGGTGKGSDGSRVDLEKYGNGLDNIKDEDWQSCGGCRFFKGGFDVLGNTLCSEVDGFNLNDGKKCDVWEK